MQRVASQSCNGKRGEGELTSRRAVTVLVGLLNILSSVQSSSPLARMARSLPQMGHRRRRPLLQLLLRLPDQQPGRSLSQLLRSHRQEGHCQLLLPALSPMLLPLLLDLCPWLRWLLAGSTSLCRRSRSRRYQRRACVALPSTSLECVYHCMYCPGCYAAVPVRSEQRDEDDELSLSPFPSRSPSVACRSHLGPVTGMSFSADGPRKQCERRQGECMRR